MLVRWNVQIAQNIISGEHNILAHASEQSLLLVDDRGIPDDGGTFVAEKIIKAEMAKVIPKGDRWLAVKASSVN